MKILFINAALGGDFSALDIGVTALATYVNERSPHRAAICDLTFHRRHWQQHLDTAIARQAPDLIGISVNTLFLQHVLTVCRHIKRRYRLPIIAGGYHASIHPEATVRLPEIDYVCCGDGELPLVALLDHLAANTVPALIQGLWFKNLGDPVPGGRGAFFPDLNSLPVPDYTLWEDLDRYFYFLGMLYVIGTRGCPYSCTYCDAHGISSSVDGHYYRIRDPGRYAEELAAHYERFAARGLRLFQLFDQVFTMDPAWLRAFCVRYRELGLHRRIRFSAFSRIDHLDEEKICLLSAAGCALLRVGIEAGDEQIRTTVYHKQIRNDAVRRIFALCRQHGIGFTAFYMLGGPGEHPVHLQRTIDFALELDAERSAFFIFKPFTEAGQQLVVQHGGVIAADWWQAVDNITFGVAVDYPHLPARVIQRYQYRAYLFTFGRRLGRLLRREGLAYFRNLLLYLVRGLRCGMSPAYLFTYFHVYGEGHRDR